MVSNECRCKSLGNGSSGTMEKSTRVTVYNTIRNGFSSLRLLRPHVEIYDAGVYLTQGPTTHVCDSDVDGASPRRPRWMSKPLVADAAQSRT